MDSIHKMAISQISDVLSKGNLIKPKVDVWKKVFCNVGLSELYYKNENKLIVRRSEKDNEEYEHSSECYSVLNDIFLNLDEFSQFIKLIQSITENMDMYSVFHKDINVKMNITFYMTDILEHLKRKYLSYRLYILDKYPGSDFSILRNNLNLLGLDFTFNEGEEVGLIVVPISLIEKSKDRSNLIGWLNNKYSNTLNFYEKAVKSYVSCDGVGTLKFCKNAIKEILSNEDNDIKKITQHEKVYGFSKAIKYLNLYLEDLEVDENTVAAINQVKDEEVIGQHDALLGLRMTEDILTWLYQNQYYNK